MKNMKNVCDECMTAAYDEGAEDEEMQADICRSIGADIADHTCERLETNKACACACKFA